MPVLMNERLDIPKQLTSRLSSKQLKALYPYVRSKVVHDLGAGDGTLACELVVSCGAEKVIAIDRHPIPDPPIEGIECLTMYFDRFHEKVDIAFVSWPVNWPCALEPILRHARLVVYLGKNTDGSQCGYQGFWELLVEREVLLHIPERPNVLIVYGQNKVERQILPEEYAAIQACTDEPRVYDYDELYEHRFARLNQWIDELG